MNFSRSLIIIFLSLALSAGTVVAQNKPIGSWRSFLPYRSAVGVATDGVNLYTATSQAFFTLNSMNGQLDAYSKVEGMSDIGMQCIAYDMATGVTVLVYTNGNIDLFKDNTFYNIPELKVKTIAGAKTVHSVYTLNGLAYLCTSLGVIVLDLDKQNIKETYEFNINNRVIPVMSILAQGDSLYAVAETGIYVARKSSNELQNFQIWKPIDTVSGFHFIAGSGTDLFVANDQEVYHLVDTGLALVYKTEQAIERIDGSDSGIIVSLYNPVQYNGAMLLYNLSGGIYDSIDLGGAKPLQVVTTMDGSFWLADEFGGLTRVNEKREIGYFSPTGPIHASSYDIYANNKELWIVHGGFSDNFLPLGNFSGMANYKDDKWKYFTRFVYPPFDTLTDFSVFLKDEVTNTVYAGSFKNGLFILNDDGTNELLGVNSIFDPSISQGPAYRQIAGLGLDSKRNLWVSTMFSQSQLYARNSDNQWFKFKLNGAPYGGNLLVDDEDQIWFIGYGGGGLFVYNANGTIGDKSDDASYHFATGAGYGNLPSNNVNCIAKDKNNNIWVGTSNGIGIINNCSAPFSQTPPCDAEIPIVQYDQYAGYLFAGNNVRSIAVDGANRKWVGTDDGVWLLSPDAGKIVFRFTTDNSPLPSNRIQKIAIDNVTGDVYIGTEQGLISYRSTATEGGTSNSNVISYPNPVPSGYGGTIAIKGLVTNADVRITDINGQLVYRTKALGGQAVWNGLDYTGRRPQTGVYLIFASDADGTEKYTGKLVFLK
jgi:hypothetical protein